MRRFQLESVAIDGEPAVAVLKFEPTELVEPPFIIDHGNMLSTLDEWVQQTVDRPEPPVLVINGLVKTGKTASLQYVLPQLACLMLSSAT